MAPFDAELYLRLLGERQLAVLLGDGGQHRGDPDDLPDAASALTAVGLIEAELARRIVVNYAMAMGRVRASSHPGAHRIIGESDVAPDAEPVPLAPRTMFLLGVTVALPGAELSVRALTLSRESARIEGYLLSDPDSPSQGAAVPRLGLRGSGAGPTVDAVFSKAAGRRIRGVADGVWETAGPLGAGPLGADLGWIEICGQRVELFDPVRAPTVEIESCATERVAVRYLWQLLALVHHHRHPGRVPAAADALIAAGLFREEDPELEAVLWANDANAGRASMRSGTVPGHGPPHGGVPAAVPTRWRSLLGRPGLFKGVNGTLAVGAVTPLFGGASIAVNTLSAGPDHYRISVDTAEAMAEPTPMVPGTMARAITWWASDDRGNHYLGMFDSKSTDDARGRGAAEIHFDALDPRASELTLTVTTLSARAQIPIPLLWDE